MAPTEQEQAGCGAPAASVVVPAYNAAATLPACLEALGRQRGGPPEIVLVDDGSKDDTATVAGSFPGVRVIRQANAGPAAARNRGVAESQGEFVLFTDSDCVPEEGWAEALLGPLRERPEVAGTKGIYFTRQRGLVARFVQLEYESKYAVMEKHLAIDFVDTYCAAFRRADFLAAGGYDPAFTTACAEDVDLSYRLANAGKLLLFVPAARVAHRHPERLGDYLRKKFRFAYWRVLAVRKSPNKALRDSHTPQAMKLQMLLVPVLAAALASNALAPNPSAWAVLAAHVALGWPFLALAARRDPALLPWVPFALLARSVAQFGGVAWAALRLLMGKTL